jgi:hypothetical protein
MADFQFEVEISAKIQELEQALNKAAKSTQEAANKIADAVEKNADPAFENLLKTIGKVSAGLFLAEGAFKLGGAAARALAGDGEGVVQMLNSLPVIGPLVTSFNEFAEALFYASEGATEARNRLYEMELAAKRAGQAATALGGQIQAQAELMKLMGASDVRIQRVLFEDRLRLLKMNHEARLRQIHEERVAESKAIEEANLSIDDETAAMQEVARRRRQAIKDSEAEFEIRKRILERQLAEAEFQKEQVKLQKEENAEAERRAELAERTKEAQQAIVDKMKEASKAAAEFMKKALQRAKELEEQNKRAAKVVEDVNESLDRRMRRTAAKGDPEAEKQVQRQFELEDLRKKFEEEIQKAREKGNQQLQRQLEQEKKIAEEKLKQIHALEDQKATQDAADDAAKKAAEEEKKRAEEAAKIAEKQKELEAETAMMRQDAQKQVAAATVSFATAGGTFVTGASAQVNEAKILNKIQKKSQELLERIAENTSKPTAGVTLA